MIVKRSTGIIIIIPGKTGAHKGTEESVRFQNLYFRNGKPGPGPGTITSYITSKFGYLRV